MSSDISGSANPRDDLGGLIPPVLKDPLISKYDSIYLSEEMYAMMYSAHRINYCGDIIYENLKPTPNRILFNGGYVTFSNKQPVYHFYLTDHQGNVRVVADGNGTVEQISHYYPFGALFGEVRGDDGQRYRYNGKELERLLALDWYDYGARWYDPVLGIWHSIDPLAGKYPSVSPYVYCLNNPMRYIDLKGLAPGDFFLTVDAAAIDFGMYYNCQSIKDNIEYASYIFKIVNENGESGYSYGIADKGNFGTLYKCSTPTLRRNGLQDGGTYGLVDNLTYTYDGNQLTKISDSVEDPSYVGAFNFRDGADCSAEYTYDANGSMTSDKNRGITSVTYNVINQPERIAFSDGSATEYVYGYDGTKLQTVHKTRLPQSSTTTTYSKNLIYEDGVLKRMLVDGGYATFSGGTPEYHFFIHDHLGNNRIVATADGTVEQENHYYPYGGLMADICTGSDTQPYKYNGKELDRMHGLDTYDYGARQHDAATGRWDRMDPLAKENPEVSPYVYCLNNPMNAIDPDGKKIVLVGTREERMLILGQMQKLTNDKLGVRRSTGEVIIMSRGTKNLNRSLKTGTSLISSVISNKHTTTIELTTDDSHTHPVYRMDRENGKGTDSQILYNIGDNPSVLTKDNATGKIYEEAIPSHIVLGHELIHGQRNMNGTATNRDIKTKYEYTDTQGNVVTVSKKQDELETVGIINDERNKEYTENKLRKEQHLNIRIQY